MKIDQYTSQDLNPMSDLSEQEPKDMTNRVIPRVDIPQFMWPKYIGIPTNTCPQVTVL